MGHNAHRMQLIFVISLFLSMTAPVHAISFSFAPMNFNIQAKPGQIVNQTFTLTLAKDMRPTQFKAHIEDWWRSADNNQTFFAAPGTLRKSCGTWCAINPTEALVQPGDTLAVKLSIRVPADAEPGGYWAALTVDEIPDPLAPKPSGVSISFKASLSVGINVEVPTATLSAKLKGVRIGENRAFVTVCNEGNTPVRVSGTIEFYKHGEEKPTATIQLSNQPLLPEPINTVEFSAPLPSANDLPSGKYKVRAIIDAGLDYLMGLEKELQIVRSDDK